MAIPPEVWAAILAVESGGQGLDKGRPLIRFEAHVFDRRWGRQNPGEFDLHFYFDADKPWTGQRVRLSPGAPWVACHGSQDREWEALDLASTLGVGSLAAAHEATSWGAAQLMGFHYQALGYSSAFKMGEAMKSEAEQDRAFKAFVGADPRMVRALESEDWPAFARIYNGPGQAEVYGGRIRDAVARLRRG